MKTELFTFSGTGNSLSVAKQLSHELQDCTIRLINHSCSGEVESLADRVGILFPVYFLDVPEVVVKFIEALSLKEGSEVFAIATCGAMEGKALYSLEQRIIDKGFSFTGGYTIYLPDNSLVFPTKTEEYQKMFAEAESKIVQIAQDLSEGSCKLVKKNYFLTRLIASPIKIVFYKFYKIGNKGAKQESCTSCGVCEKTCPVGNIEIAKSGPCWSDHCAECFACYHVCPQQSVYIGKYKGNKDMQYFHPQVKVKELWKG